MLQNQGSGRVIEVDSNRLSITLRNEKGISHFQLSSAASVELGDIAEVKNGNAVQLTPNRTSANTAQWMQRVLDPRRHRGIKMRQNVEAGIREFFLSHGFLETKTPLLVPCPGMETHIRPFRVSDCGEKNSDSLFLPTSPEFMMKRLLVGGLEKIFQICPAFRDEPKSITHLPEFTILEWYRAYAGYEEIMADTENLFEFLAIKLFGKPSLIYQGQEISVKTPWPRLRVRDLFQDWIGVDLVTATRETLAEACKRFKCNVMKDETWDDLFFKLWLNEVEPRFPKDRAVFVTRFPASQAALAVVDSDPDGSRWARRFELYAAGLELGNAFEELTDPVEQRARFIKDMELREKLYGPAFPKNPLDEEFLGALVEGMPPSGGIALGVDRMIMLFGDEADIQFTTWLG